ncbi:craniofacial development protein 2-like [Orbicella faveolata]|uniref:craniofacial development protein 2-like n=1 Tax=Orbicella faveolata TaxID=48498 RepID=UPI0009E446D5|nr:craniofacial development protein 2-like [Orbicella faveolata]
MTSGSESQQEAVAARLGASSTKTKTRLGFWNVTTMFSTGRLAQITRETNENKLHILGISECRWAGFGSQRTQGGETILFSGRNDNLHRQGVALILKRSVEKSLLEWKPINGRLIRARFFGKQVKMTVIQCYAPANDADPEQKDIFYETLQAEVENTPSQDLLIVMGYT